MDKRDRVYQAIVKEDERKVGDPDCALAPKESLYNSESWKKIRKWQHSEVLDAGLLDVGLLNLVWEPSRAASRLRDHRNAACEAVDTLGATLS